MKGAVAGLSGSLALVLLFPMEAGVPIPVPADLVMFTVGERVAAGKFPSSGAACSSSSTWSSACSSGRWPTGPSNRPRARP